MPVQAGWMDPPAGIPIMEVTPQALRGASAGILRAALLGTRLPEWVEALVPTLPGGARRFLLAAPSPDEWVPMEDIRPVVAALDPQDWEILQRTVGRLVAEQAAGKLPWAPPEASLFPGEAPEDLLRNVPGLLGAYFKGGSAHLDSLGPGEAWVSIRLLAPWPGWATHTTAPWFKRALEGRYGVQAEVDYLEPPADRTWWHRFHIRWS